MQDAENVLKSMLVGAYLDEIRAHSIQLTLRFFSDQIRLGARITVDLVLTCNAHVVSNSSSAGRGDEDFFVARADFLSRVYGLIGRDVLGLQLHDGGALAIRIDGASILLTLSSDDYKDGDWVWKLELEDGVNVMTGNDNLFYCTPEGDGVQFYIFG